MTWFCLAADLGDQLLGRLATGLGVTGIHGQDFRMEELHQRRTADAGDLQMSNTLLLQILAGAEGEGIGRAQQRAGIGVSTLATFS